MTTNLPIQKDEANNQGRTSLFGKEEIISVSMQNIKAHPSVHCSRIILFGIQDNKEILQTLGLIICAQIVHGNAI